MFQRRRFERVDIRYPIYCVFTNNDVHTHIKSNGYVHDLSIGGMRICVPLPPELYNSQTLEYQLVLPEPFQTITGNGQIKWAERIESDNCLIFGMAFTDLNDKHRKDLECIIDELEDEPAEDCPQPPAGS